MFLLLRDGKSYKIDNSFENFINKYNSKRFIVKNETIKERMLKLLNDILYNGNYIYDFSKPKEELINIINKLDIKEIF